MSLPPIVIFSLKTMQLPNFEKYPCIQNYNLPPSNCEKKTPKKPIHTKKAEGGKTEISMMFFTNFENQRKFSLIKNYVA